MPLHKTSTGMRMWTTSCLPMEVVSEIIKEIGASPIALRSESLPKGARGGVKDLRTDLDPLDKLKVTTPGTVKISPKSGHAQSVQEVTLTGIGRQHASAVGLPFICPGAPGPPLLSLTVSLEGVVTSLVAAGEELVSDGVKGSEDHAKYGHSTY